MNSEKNQRRDFLKKLGLGTVALGFGIAAPKVLGKTASGYLVENEEEYGGVTVEMLTDGKLPYEANPEVLRNIEERMNVFSRNIWDPVRKEQMDKALIEQGGREIFDINMVDSKGMNPNQSRLDYALMQAAWATAHMEPFYDWKTHSGEIKQLADFGKWDPSELDMNWNDVSIAVKHASLFFGATLAGIAKINPLWIYDEYRDKNESINDHESQKVVPSTMKHVISLAFEEDYDGIMNSPGRLASAAVGDGYSRMAITSHKVAEFIRALGYHAIPSGNETGLSIPIAIDAGLGELGRNGLLITPKYGPRIRLAKVFTDMPLVADVPIRFGVKEFCDVCLTCAKDCPSASISEGSRTWKGKSVSNNPGVLKWYIDPESCFDYNGFSCSNCKRNCPFNKPNNSWLHALIRKNINLKVKPLDKLMVTFDQASGYGKQIQNSEFWEKDGLASITARDPEI